MPALARSALVTLTAALSLVAAPAALAGAPPSAPTILGQPGLAVGVIDDADGAPIGLTWIPPTDPGSGLATYEFERARGACTSWAAVTSIPAPGATTGVVQIRPRRGVNACLRMRAVDTDGQQGAWTSAPLGKLAMYQEKATTADATGTRVTYSGSWKTRKITGVSGGRVRWSTSSDATATFEFRGTSIAIVTDRMPGHGSFFLTLDGNPVDANPSSIPVDPFTTDSPTRVLRVVRWARNALTPGDLHTLVVRPRGDDRIDIDGFLVRR
jgi:hypothetical protein